MARILKGPPEVLDELGEALDLMEVTYRELRRQKRALFPAVIAYRRSVESVRRAWRHYRTGITDTPLLERMGEGPPAPPVSPAKAARKKSRPKDTDGHVDEPLAITVTEELPDFGQVESAAESVPRPEGGWNELALLAAAEELGIPDWRRVKLCVKCEQAFPAKQTRCPVCKGSVRLVGGLVRERYLKRNGKFKSKPKGST
jgi:hypothetical protein